MGWRSNTVGTGSYPCSEWHKTSRDISVGVWPSPATGLFLVIEEAEGGRIKVAASEHFGGGRKRRYKGSEQPFRGQSDVAMRAVILFDAVCKSV